MIAQLLHDCNYTLDQQYQYLLLYALHIIPFLGPYPDRDFLASTGDDPFNRLTINDAVTRLKNLDRGTNLNLELYRELTEALTLTDKEEAIANTKEECSRVFKAQHLLALDLKHDASMIVKAYWLPRVKSLVTGVSMSELMFNAVSKVDRAGLRAGALALVRDFMAESPLSTSSYFFSCDLIDPAEARYKIYVLESQVDFDAIRRHWTMGGRLKGEEIEKGLEILYQLWECLPLSTDQAGAAEVLNPDVEKSPEARTAVTRDPLALNYELRPGESEPQVKIYLPMRGLNDFAVADGMSRFFEGLGWAKYAEEYGGMAQGYLDLLHPGAELGGSGRFQSWLSFSYSARTGVYMTIYYH
ncbi:tryptophan dimethylallyltransferase-domain-containing protein [Aspergillus karnatakaensis]|uniref:tryptophan dimethylallyltransferase-domain-containing protein n=1 Tax=Aspergillus karnatakaensis TaxID=1810916 RepID=UPI003CCDBF34